MKCFIIFGHSGGYMKEENMEEMADTFDAMEFSVVQNVERESVMEEIEEDMEDVMLEDETARENRNMEEEEEGNMQTVADDDDSIQTDDDLMELSVGTFSVSNLSDLGDDLSLNTFSVSNDSITTDDISVEGDEDVMVNEEYDYDPVVLSMDTSPISHLESIATSVNDDDEGSVI
jgi:hypothetical protein